MEAFLAPLIQEMLHECRNSPGVARRSGGQLNGDDVQPVVEIFSELFSFFNGLLQDYVKSRQAAEC